MIERAKREQMARDFRTLVKGANFMTPYLRGYAFGVNIICEVTTGTDFDRRTMWGVTVVRYDENGKPYRDNKSSQPFQTFTEAREHCETLGASEYVEARNY